MSKEILTREETFEFIGALFANAMAGENKVDIDHFRGRKAVKEHIEAAVENAMQLMASEINKIPDKLGLNFEDTEHARKLTDDMLSSIAVQVKLSFDKLSHM